MAYYTVNNGSVSVPSTQYVNQGAYFTQPTISTYPQAYPVSHDRPAPNPGKYTASFRNTGAIWLGALLVCCSALAMAGSGPAFRCHAGYSEVGAGLWCGAMFAAAGAVAIVAGYHTTDRLIIGTTATSGVTIIFGITLVSLSGYGLSSDISYFDCYRWCYSYRCSCNNDNWNYYAIVGNGMMVCAGSLAIIFAITLFVFCCVALCRKTSPQMVPMPVQPMTVQYIPAATQPMTTTVISNQQMFSVPVQYVQMPAPPNQPVVLLPPTVPQAPDQPPDFQAATVFQAPNHHQPEPSDAHHHNGDPD